MVLLDPPNLKAILRYVIGWEIQHDTQTLAVQPLFKGKRGLVQGRDAGHDGQTQSVACLAGSQYAKEAFSQSGPLFGGDARPIVSDRKAYTAIVSACCFDPYSDACAAVANGIANQVT